MGKAVTVELETSLRRAAAALRVLEVCLYSPESLSAIDHDGADLRVRVENVRFDAGTKTAECYLVMDSPAGNEVFLCHDGDPIYMLSLVPAPGREVFVSVTLRLP